MSSIQSLIDFVRSDLVKLFRFAAVSLVTVPLGQILLFVFVQGGMSPVASNVLSFIIATIPNYLLNRYWVWNKKSSNSVKREIVPFCLVALLGLVFSTILIAIADVFTDLTLVFMAVSFFAYGVVWVLKFFVLEKYLFGEETE